MAFIIHEFANAEAAAQAAAEAISAALKAALDAGPAASFAGSGGRTPGPLYDHLSAAPLDWDRVTVTLTDERWVEPDSPDSNERLLRQRLLTGLAGGARFAPLKSPSPTPEQAAAVAEALVAPLLPFDAVLLGMGEDGHVASLFRGNPALAAAGVVAVAPAGEPMPPQPRLTLTFDALKSAGLLLLLIGGEAKRRVLDCGSGLPVHTLEAWRAAPISVYWWP